jgi:hypothetical protein
MPLRRETACLTVLEFFEFSRPNRALSKRYAGKTEKHISRRFPAYSSDRAGSTGVEKPNHRVVHEGKLSLDSDFSQLFAALSLGTLSSDKVR